MEIPGYKILKTLGQGGMATVYLAIQENFQRQVAVKVMSPQLAQDPSFGERFQREARIVSQMNHPNIVTVYDVGVANNCHYLAMQYVEGRELRYRLDQMSLPDKLKVVKDVASALNYAGNKGYVHRDVKPENVMMSDEDGRAILMDFGIAKASDGNHSMTKTGMAIGTPYYMSPEQAQGKPVDNRSDLYSLGVMFFQLLTGHVPYDAESGVAIGIKHVTEPVPLLPAHLQGFQPIVAKIMAKNPDERYQKGAEFIRDLDRIDMNMLDQVDQILQREVYKTTTTDPHAQTVFAPATPPPPTLNTGNVTTADAARLAQRISVGEPIGRKAKTGKLSSLLALVVVSAVLGGAWYFLQTQNAAVAPAATGLPAMEATVPAELPVGLSAPPETTVVPAPPVSAVPAVAVSEAANEKKRLEEEQARQAAEAEEQKRLAEETKIAKEKAQQDVARERKRQEELSRAKVETETKAAAAAAEQAKRDEVARRLRRAKELHEKGMLAVPENDNAILAYRQVLEVDPANPTATLALKTIEANYLLGIRTLTEQGELDQAEAQLRAASKLYPDSKVINEMLTEQRQKVAENAAAKAAEKQIATQPRIGKLVINDAAFDGMQLVQKTKLPLSRSAYVGFSYENFQGPTTPLQVVLYDGARITKIMQNPVVVTGANGQSFLTLRRPVEGFADGGYVVDIMLGDRRLASAEFVVGR